MKDKLKKLTEEWQTKWSDLQDLIQINIKSGDGQYAYHNQLRAGTLKSCLKDIYSLLQSENTESVSDDTTESGVLHGVSESLANDLTDKVSQSSVDGTLEKITETEKICFETVEHLPDNEFIPLYKNVCDCRGYNCFKRNMKDS